MIRRILLLVVGLLLGALFGVQLAAQRAPVAIEPRVIAGPDVGFRAEGFNGKTPIGKLVVRVNGQWVDVELGGIYSKVVPGR